MASSGGNRSRLLLVLLLVSSLFLITLDLRGVNLASGIRSGVSTVISPVENLFTKVFSPVGNFASDVRNFGQSKKQITELNKQIDLLKDFHQMVILQEMFETLDNLSSRLLN